MMEQRILLRGATMPYYEYECEECGAGFERRLRVQERLDPQPCPQCGAARSKLRMSVPAMVGATAASPARVCPSSGEACGCAHAVPN